MSFTGVVLAVEHDEARALLAQLDGAVEELGGVDGLGLDPLHLLEDAHGVVVGLAQSMPEPITMW